jgi:hypothetical protein
MSPGCLAGGFSAKRITLVNWGCSPAVYTPNPMISMCFDNRKEGPPRILEAVPLSLGHIMASGDTCPLGTSNARHVATLAGLKASQPQSTTSHENLQSGSTADSYPGQPPKSV